MKILASTRLLVSPMTNLFSISLYEILVGGGNGG